MRRTPDGTGPVGHEDILGVFEAVGAGTCVSDEAIISIAGLSHSRRIANKGKSEHTCAHSLLALLQLSEELEVAGHLSNRHCVLCVCPAMVDLKKRCNREEELKWIWRRAQRR